MARCNSVSLILEVRKCDDVLSVSRALESFQKCLSKLAPWFFCGLQILNVSVIAGTLGYFGPLTWQELILTQMGVQRMQIKVRVVFKRIFSFQPLA